MNKTLTKKIINGHVYHFLALPGTDLFKLEIVNKIGSNIERLIDHNTQQNLYGMSHFVEHLSFRATKDYTSAKLIEILRTEGIYNASTNHERINYWFKTVSDNHMLAIKLVCNYAFNDLKKIPKSEFEIEKKVVYNEAKRYLDDLQTSFHFNMTPTVCGYDEEDNIIGLPSTISTFKLEDAIMVKNLMLENGVYDFKIVYDNEILTEDDIIEKIEKQLKRFKMPNPSNAFSDNYTKLAGFPKLGKHIIDNDADQTITTLLFYPPNVSIFVMDMAHDYLESYASTSLSKIIREDHGLTYGVSLGTLEICDNTYIGFSCDVSKGNQKLLLKLFKKSINQSVKKFTKRSFNELRKALHLQRTMRLINQERYDDILYYSAKNIESFEKYRKEFSNDVHKAYETMLENEVTYKDVKKYLDAVLELVNGKKYSFVTNTN